MYSIQNTAASVQLFHSTHSIHSDSGCIEYFELQKRNLNKAAPVPGSSTKTLYWIQAGVKAPVSLYNYT